MKKEIEELKRRLAEAERRVEALEKKDGKVEYHFHSYPPVYVPQPAPNPFYSPINPPIICNTMGDPRTQNQQIC